MRRRIMCAALSALLVLAGCAGQEEGKGEPGVLERASDLAPDVVVAKGDGWEVRAGRWLCALAFACDELSAGSGGQVDWNSDHGGETLGEYAKAQALETAAVYAVVEYWADTCGCVLTAAEQAGIDAAWDAAAEQAGGETEYLRGLERMGLDEAGARALSADYYLYARLYGLYCTPGSPLYPAEGLPGGTGAESEPAPSDGGESGTDGEPPVGSAAEEPAAAGGAAGEAAPGSAPSDPAAAAFDALLAGQAQQAVAGATRSYRAMDPSAFYARLTGERTARGLDDAPRLGAFTASSDGSAAPADPPGEANRTAAAAGEKRNST